MLSLLAAAMATLGSPGAPAEELAPMVAQPAPMVAEPATMAADAPVFEVTQFIFRYGRLHPELPDLQELQELVVELGRTEAGYVAPSAEVPSERLRLGDLPAGDLQRFYPSALLRINEEVVRHFNRVHQLIGVYVEPAGEDIDTTDPAAPRDIRGGRGPLTVVIWVGVVTRTRSIASGDRISTDERINSPLHRWILERSPVRPAGEYLAELVSASAFEADSLKREHRRDEQTGKELVVTVGRLLASGERSDQAIGYPVTVWSEAEAREHAERVGAVFRDRDIERQDLLRRRPLDDYVHRLSRHPGRRVDLAFAAAGRRRGEVDVDFMVTERKPWLAYFQISNTGTQSTGEWRQRFGLVHNQLTDNDDILSVDYSTANFDDSQVLTGSYEAPVLHTDWLRWRVYGSWNEFTASDIGIVNTLFEGEGTTVGAEVIFTFFQHADLFLDAVVGAEWRDIMVDGPVTSPGKAQFLVPHAGLRAQRVRDTSSTLLEVDFEWTQRGVAGIDDPDNEIPLFGRGGADADWEVLSWQAYQSMFLEPLLNPAAWRDPQSVWATLAHELAFNLRGQYALDNRLIPHAEYVAGGLYTVRGYPENALAGDTVLVFTTEYRFYLPRAINPWARRAQPTAQEVAEQAKTAGGTIDVFGRKVRYVPSHPYGQADLDLIFRTFFDMGRVMLNKRQTGDPPDQTMSSVGIGVEVKYLDNISLRVDAGVPLQSIQDDENTQAGDWRVHFVATLLY